MKLVFLGDLCVSGSGVPNLSPSFKEFVKGSDLLSVNLEAPIVNRDLISDYKVGPCIKQSEKAVVLCRDLGVTHCAVANNHIMDYGDEGLIDTFSSLSGVDFIGAGFDFDEIYSPSWFEKDGITVALFSFAEAQFGVCQDAFKSPCAGYAWVDHPQARKSILSARNKADFIIVQVHAGLEMVGFPIPEWRCRYRELVDIGADLVVGHHPHVLQGSESYKEKMIHYSLGNFYMDVMFNQDDPGSGAALKVTINENGLSSEIIHLKATFSNIDLDKSLSKRMYYKSLCAVLLDYAEYENKINKICDDFWESVYRNYYESALMGLGTVPSFSSAYLLLRRIAAFLIKGRRPCRQNEMMLVHNIRIETHRWVVERALFNRSMKK